MNERLLQTLVTVAFGAVAGGVTNAIAVWMLFHPYLPPRVFGRELRFLQGALGFDRKTVELHEFTGTVHTTPRLHNLIARAWPPSNHTSQPGIGSARPLCSVAAMQNAGCLNGGRRCGRDWIRGLV